MIREGVHEVGAPRRGFREGGTEQKEGVVGWGCSSVAEVLGSTLSTKK
jgi:hypothetical protein